MTKKKKPHCIVYKCINKRINLKLLKNYDTKSNNNNNNKMSHMMMASRLYK